MREEIEARPALLLFIGFVLGLVALPFPVACLFLAGFAFWVRLLPRKWLLVGSFVIGLVLSPVPRKSLVERTIEHGVGVVTAVPILMGDSQRTEVSIEGRTLMATMPLLPSVMLGDHIRVSGVAKPIELTQPRMSAFDRVEGRISLERVEVVSEGSWVAHLADGWRRSFLGFLQRALSTRDANLVDAVCFNGRALIDGATREELVQSGLIHLISASGLQVFVLAYLTAALLRFFPVPRSVGVLILACVLTVYAIGAGLQPQIVRAAFMSVAGIAAFLVGREPDALSALSLSGIAYLLWRPESVYGMSFQISMIVVGSVSLFFRRDRGSPTGNREAVIRFAQEFGRLSWVVLLASTPLVAYYLGVVSLPSVFANLMVCWATPLVVAAAFVAHAVSLVLPTVGEAMANLVLTPLSHWVHGVAGLMGSGWGGVPVPDFNGLWLVIFYGAWSMTYRRRVVQP
jgi:competence protein ComEC